MVYTIAKRTLALLVALILLTACDGLAGEPEVVATLPPEMLSNSNPNAQAAAVPASAPDIALGAQVYAENCTRCHGIGGAGDGELVKSGQVPAIMDFTNPATTVDKTPANYFDVITNGRLETSLMPPWEGSLNEEQRWAVAMYVYTLPYSAAQVAQGQDVWNTNCASCHGGTGEGADRGAALPNLWTVTQGELLQIVATGNITPDQNVPDMPAFADRLTEAERASAILYARSLSLSNANAIGVQEIAQAPDPVGTNEVLAPAGTDEATTTTAQPTLLSTPSGVVGAIVGTIENGTEGGAAPTGLTVNLYAFPDMQNIEELGETTMNDDGTFTFNDVELQHSYSYAVTTEYNGILFASDIAPADPTTGMVMLPLKVYETSSDPKIVEVESLSSQVIVEGGFLQVIQIARFITNANYVYLAEDGTSVRLKAPDGAQVVNFMGGEDSRFQFTDTEVIDTEPVVPGQAHTVHMMYTMDYGGLANIAQPIAYTLKNGFEVLMGTAGLTISGDNIQPLGGRDTNAGTLMSFGTTEMQAAGEPMTFKVSGMPATTASSTATIPATNSSTNTVALVLIGVGGIAVGAAGALFIKDRRTAPVTPVNLNEQERMNALVKQIADLDIDHQAGKISKAEYDRRRSQLKAELAGLMKKNGK